MIALLVLVVAVCLLCEAFFSGSETAVISAERTELRAAARRGDKRAALAETLLEKPEALLGTTLVGTNLAVVAGTSVATLIVGHYVAPGWRTTVTTLAMTPLILLFGEIIPKSIARAGATAITLRIAAPLRHLQRLMHPLVALAGRITEATLALFGSRPTGASPYVTRGELKALAHLGEEHGLLVSVERRMIQSILELRERPVSSVMVPLVDMASIEATTTVAELEDLAARFGFSRFPVYEDRVDNVVGIVNPVEVLHATEPAARASLPLAPFIRREVTYVPETKAVGDLLHELRDGTVPMAIVVDEHGGVVGLATTEDLAEEVIGRIRDERRDLPQEAVAASGSVFECEGKMEIEELAERTGAPIAKQGFNTVAGLVTKLTGRIPQAGETIDHGPLHIEILDADARQVKRLRIVRAPSEPEAGHHT